MRKTFAVLLVGGLSLAAACSDFLDVNTNPNAPQSVSANLYLPPMLHWMVTSPQLDGRFVGHYTQQWYSTSTNFSPASTWGKMGYDAGSDNAGQQWRDVYWNLGQNLVDMNAKATAEHRWDLLGVGLILKAWGWQVLTDLHGEIIIQEAFDPTRTTFDYDTQQYAYQEVRRLLDSAIVLLRTDTGAVDQAYLAKGDAIYGGDRTKWLRFAHGLLALHLNHFSNKLSVYDAARVMAEVDSSFRSKADDPLLQYPGTQNDDRNFWGPTRANLNLYRQTRFIVGLMDSTQFGVVDPRMTRMLAPAPDGKYRGLDVNQSGFSGLPTAQRPGTFYGRYIFDDRARLPVITYAQLQFIKAEAALRASQPDSARAAYIRGIRAHIAFVNDRNRDIATGAPAQITAAEESTFIASPAVVPPVGSLTLSHIISQKMIAQWGWGHNEMWMDMRRFHYTDAVGGTQVIRGFTPPITLFSDNAGEVVQRIRPRFNSEYVWNRPGLDAIGGLATNYHTQVMWIIITQP